jgi:amino acid permease
LNDEDEILKKSEDIFRKRKIALIFYYSSIFILFTGWVFSYISKAAAITLLILGVICFALFLLILHIYWKCPCCDNSFEIRKSSGFTHCPYCGARLR